MKQYNKSENWKKEMKALKKQNKMIYIISNKSGLRREIKRINKIRGEILRRVATLPVIIRNMIPC